MTKIITANLMIWKSMDLHTDSRTKYPAKNKVKKITKHDHKCHVCRDVRRIYNPITDSYRKCRRCTESNSGDYDWLD